MIHLALLLHPAQTLSWNAWTIHPSTVIGLTALGWLYFRRARSAEGVGPSTAQRVAFTSGLLLLFIILNGPLHDLSDFYLFSGHMVQHLIMELIVPPLLITGTPGWMLRPALQWPVLRWFAPRITSGPMAFAIFNITLCFWHIPALYNLALLHHNVHIVQHLTFLVASVLMWWPFLSPLPELPRLSFPGQMLYCFLMTIPMSVVAIYIAMADTVLYPLYASSPRLWGLTPKMDQLIGGLIMWVPGGLFFYGVMTVVFFRWQRQGNGGDEVADAQASSGTLASAIGH
ncbi:MAG: cytochrome c oxidase assembly protein [Gemmatimonadaceae bacterium]|nr:cytochrome c oxidase assembly protein [Gemmatimonadaceae bacterium]